MDETLCDEYEMELNEKIMLSEADYAEVMAQLAQDCEDIYSDEDLYNMEMLEREELDLIYPSQPTDDYVTEVQLTMETVYPSKVSDTFEMDGLDGLDCQLYENVSTRVVDKTKLIASSLRPMSYRSILMTTSFKNASSSISSSLSQ